MQRRNFLKVTGFAGLAAALGITLPTRAASTSKPADWDLRPWRVAAALHKQRPLDLGGNAMEAKPIPGLLDRLLSDDAYAQQVSLWYWDLSPLRDPHHFYIAPDAWTMHIEQELTKITCSARTICDKASVVLPLTLVQKRPGLFVDTLALICGLAQCDMQRRIDVELARHAPWLPAVALGLFVVPPRLTFRLTTNDFDRERRLQIVRGPLMAGIAPLYPIGSHGCRVRFTSYDGKPVEPHE